MEQTKTAQTNRCWRGKPKQNARNVSHGAQVPTEKSNLKVQKDPNLDVPEPKESMSEPSRHDCEQIAVARKLAGGGGRAGDKGEQNKQRSSTKAHQKKGISILNNRKSRKEGKALVSRH